MRILWLGKYLAGILSIKFVCINTIKQSIVYNKSWDILIILNFIYIILTLGTWNHYKYHNMVFACFIIL